ncbi:hypothetical protein Tco_0382560 [Tanacetum coccineum]
MSNKAADNQTKSNMSNKAADNMPSTVEQPTTDLFPEVTNVAEVQPKKVLFTPINAGDAEVGGGGALGDALVEMKTKNIGLYPVVLTAMNVKEYNNKIYLSSSSFTQILDDPQIPALKEYKKEISDGEGPLNQVTLHVDHSQPKDGTLENLLKWARNRKNDSSTFNCKVSMRVNEYTTNGDIDTHKQQFNQWVLNVGDGTLPAKKRKKKTRKRGLKSTRNSFLTW